MNNGEYDGLGYLIREESRQTHVWRQTEDLDESNFAYDSITRLAQAIEEEWATD